MNQIKDLGLKAGVALNPATPIQALDCILDQLDMVLIMTVNPGFGGQKFIPTLDKVRALRARIDSSAPVDIQDGGVSAPTSETAGGCQCVRMTRCVWRDVAKGQRNSESYLHSMQ